MELTFTTLILLPVGLGLLGFVEPCTVGGHLLFLQTQATRDGARRVGAALAFTLARSLVAGLFGAAMAFAGQGMIGAQTGLWLVFGSVYLVLGLAMLAGRAGALRLRLDLAPAALKRARSPGAMGLAFGLNIPACAAPILFGLLGLAAGAGSALAGFFMMFLFGLALSAPLIAFAARPRWSAALSALAERARRGRVWIGAVFVLLGLWSIWFGLYVDPQDWSMQ